MSHQQLNFKKEGAEQSSPRQHPHDTAQAVLASAPSHRIPLRAVPGEGDRDGGEVWASEGTDGVGENKLLQAVLTWVKVFLDELHLEMEDLLLEFTNGVFHFLPSRHHVAEVSNLQKHKERRSFRQSSKEVPQSCEAASAPGVSILSSRPHRGCTISYRGSPVMAGPWERAESKAAVAANLSDLRSNLSDRALPVFGGQEEVQGHQPPSCTHLWGGHCESPVQGVLSRTPAPLLRGCRSPTFF